MGTAAALWLAAAAALVLSAGAAALQYRACLWSQKDGLLRLERGVILRQETELHMHRLTAVRLTRRPLLTILGAARVEYFTPSRSSASLTLLLPCEQAARLGRAPLPAPPDCLDSTDNPDNPNSPDNPNRLAREGEACRVFGRFRPHRHEAQASIGDAALGNAGAAALPEEPNKADNPEKPEKPKKRFSAGLRSTLLTALMSTNVFSGLYLALPLLYRIGKYIGDRPRRLYGELSAEGARLLGVPRLYAALLLLIPLGFVIHFLVKALTLGRFHLTASAGGQMCLSHGVWARRTLRFRLGALTSADAVTTPLGLLLGLQRCEAELPGVGRVLLYPAMRSRELRIALASLLPRSGGHVTVRTPEQHRWRLYGWWLATAAGAVLLWLRLSASDGGFSFGTVFLPVLWLLLWRSAAGLAAARRSGISLSADWAEVVGVRGLAVHQMRLRRDAIARVTVSQSVFLRQHGLCHLRVVPKGARRGVVCRFVPLERAAAVAEQLGGRRSYGKTVK